MKLEEFSFSRLNAGNRVALLVFYTKMFQSRAAWRLCFPDGFIKNPVQATTFLVDKTQVLIGAWAETKLLGVARLENFSGQAAQIHFAFLPHTPRGDAYQIGVDFLKWISASEFRLSTLIGLIHSRNTGAINFVKDIGFEQIATIEDSGFDSREKLFDKVMVKWRGVSLT